MTLANTPKLETVIRRTVEVILRGVSTAEPGVIEAFDASTCTADVQPLLMRIVRSETGKEARRQNVVTHAPVLFVGGGGSRLTFPVARGDQCLLIVASRSLDRWSTLGQETDPQDERHHHITDAIVLVGLTPSAIAKPANATATVLESSDLRLGDDTGSALSLAADLAGLKSVLDGWTPVPNDGGAALKTAYNAYKAAHPTWPVGTTKVTAK